MSSRSAMNQKNLSSRIEIAHRPIVHYICRNWNSAFSAQSSTQLLLLSHSLPRNCGIDISGDVTDRSKAAGLPKPHISRNVPYIGGHLAIFFKSNFTQAYCVLKIILSIYMHVSFSLRNAS